MRSLHNQSTIGHSQAEYDNHRTINVPNATYHAIFLYARLNLWGTVPAPCVATYQSTVDMLSAAIVTFSSLLRYQFSPDCKIEFER